jgi:hypothetical protein
MQLSKTPQIIVSICCNKLNTSTTAWKAILTFVLHSFRAAFKLSKLSDTPQEDFTCNSEIGSESHIQYICWKEGWHGSYCLWCVHWKYVLERQNNLISRTKLALRDFKETSVTKLQALHFIWYCFISQEDEATRACLHFKLFQQFSSSTRYEKIRITRLEYRALALFITSDISIRFHIPSRQSAVLLEQTIKYSVDYKCTLISQHQDAFSDL